MTTFSLDTALVTLAKVIKGGLIEGGNKKGGEISGKCFGENPKNVG